MKAPSTFKTPNTSTFKNPDPSPAYPHGLKTKTGFSASMLQVDPAAQTVGNNPGKVSFEQAVQGATDVLNTIGNMHPQMTHYHQVDPGQNTLEKLLPWGIAIVAGVVIWRNLT